MEEKFQFVIELQELLEKWDAVISTPEKGRVWISWINPNTLRRNGVQYSLPITKSVLE